MNMVNANQIRRAVGVALLLGSGSALAYVPTSNDDADVVVYWAGASASTLSAIELTVAAVCDADTHLLYVKETAPPNADRPGSGWAVACKTAASGATKTGLGNNLKLLVIKRDAGGSGVGVGGLQTKATDGPLGNTEVVTGRIKFQTFDPAACNLSPTPGVNGAPEILGPGGTVVPIKGCTASTPILAYAEMGTSDIEPDKFIEINAPSLGSPAYSLGYRSDADRKLEEQQVLAALTFNTPVTLALYQALQSAQFPASSVCNPANAGYPNLVAVAGNIRTDITNGDSEACMPSLTRAEINGLLTGRISNFQRLLKADGTPIVAASSPRQVCRRNNGSGTQATLNALIGSFPCDINAADTSIDIVQPTATGGAIQGNSDSAAVDNCLNTFNGSANPYAIGVLSVEGRNIDNSRGWRYIKIDGVAPTLRNIHAGDYYMWAQQSCQFRNLTLLPFNPLGTPANKKAVFDVLCKPTAPSGLNSISSLLKINNPLAAPVGNCAGGVDADCGSLYTWGQSGWLATPTASLTYDNVLNSATRPVNSHSREFATGKANICQTPLRVNVGGNLTNGVIVAPNPSFTP
jgi:hypothetical protein